jgi:UDP-glucose 4-epimerase
MSLRAAKAMVIGGNGFIGSHLVDRLVARDWEVIVLDPCERRFGELSEAVRHIRADINQIGQLREALIGVDVVFHLAWASIHETANQNLVADVNANLIPSIQLIEACRGAGVRRIVFASSGGTVYGPTDNLPIAETEATNPINAYGIHKLAVEKYLRMFKHLYGLEYAILRPSVPYGPRQNPLGRQGAVSVFLYRVWQGLPLTVWGDGSNTRDYFYIEDLIEALAACAEKDLGPIPIFNIGGNEEISLVKLIERVEAVVGRKAQVEFQPARTFESQRVVLDTTRARSDLDWSPQVPFCQGLEHTWQWMRGAFS